MSQSSSTDRGLPPLQEQHLTVCGSFGFGNAGDEAVPLALTDMARALGLRLTLTVVSHMHHLDDHSVLSAEGIPAARFDAITRHPVLLSGGGVITPRFRSSVLGGCANLIRACPGSNVTLFAAGVEAAVSYGIVSHWKIARLLRHVPRLYVRDLRSLQTLRSLLPERTVSLIGDCVLWLEPAAELPLEVRAMKAYIVVNLAPRWTSDETFVPWVVGELLQVAHALRTPVVLLPFSCRHDSDVTVLRAVRDKLRQQAPELEVLLMERALGPRELAAVIAGARLVIGMRLHACVMAYAQRVPCVGLMYHPKVASFAETVGWREFFLPAAIPFAQASQTYGYRFSDLRLRHGDLLPIADRAVRQAGFERLELLKQRLAECLAAIVSSSNPSFAPSNTVRTPAPKPVFPERPWA